MNLEQLEQIEYLYSAAQGVGPYIPSLNMHCGPGNPPPHLLMTLSPDAVDVALMVVYLAICSTTARFWTTSSRVGHTQRACGGGDGGTGGAVRHWRTEYAGAPEELR